MSERKSRAPGHPSERPNGVDSPELLQQRDAFVQTFFKKGAELTEELLRENDRLRKEAMRLEHENASLRTQLASDDAIRQALKKIDALEKEKAQLLSRWSAAEATTSKYTTRFSEIEEELSNLANLYVASYQLHSTLDLQLVVRHLRELLQQLVGARMSAIYVADEKRRQLVPVASDGVAREALPRVQVEAGGEAPRGAASLIERVFLTGVPHVDEGPLANAGEQAPAACIPMAIHGRTIGVIVVYAVLEQKERFVSVDFELFKMLGAHAATAITGALLWDDGKAKVPGLEAFRDIEPPALAERS